MQFWTRFPIIIIFTIFLTVACQNQTADAVSQSLSATPQNVLGNDSPDTGLFQASFEEIREVLRMCKKGRSALQLIERYQISLRFEPGTGSRFIPLSNEIVLNSRAGNFSAALTLVHEATHARYYHEGLAADINLLNRQEYIQMKIEEELEAVINRIEATAALAESGVTVSRLPHVLYYSFRQAYGSAVRAAKFDNPGLDEDTLENIGRAAGVAAVQQAFVDDQLVTSNTQQSYIEYWGSMWDQNRMD